MNDTDVHFILYVTKMLIVAYTILDFHHHTAIWTIFIGQTAVRERSKK